MGAELDLQADTREIITQMWPEHARHLSPPGNRLGGGKIDPDEGVVCNCGEVLGYPIVQDEADYVAEEPEQPDTSGVQTGEPDNYQDPDMLEDLEGQGTPEPDWTEQQTQREQAPDPDQHGTSDEAQSWPYRGHPAYPEADNTGDGDRFEDPRDVQGGQDEPPAPPKGVMPYRDPGVVEAQDPLAARVVVIDPSRPYTPLDVEQQLLDIEGRLERGMHYQRYWEEREFAAESDYTSKSARARLEADGAKDLRDAYVQVHCEAEWRELLLCRAMVRAMRETMHTLRSLQTGYQSVLRSATDSTRMPASSRRTP